MLEDMGDEGDSGGMYQRAGTSAHSSERYRARVDAVLEEMGRSSSREGLTDEEASVRPSTCPDFLFQSEVLTHKLRSDLHDSGQTPFPYKNKTLSSNSWGSSGTLSPGKRKDTEHVGWVGVLLQAFMTSFASGSWKAQRLSLSFLLTMSTDCSLARC